MGRYKVQMNKEMCSQKSYAKKLLGLIPLPFIWTFLLIIYLIKPIVTIRFYRLVASRIGHLCSDSDLIARIRLMNNREKRTIDIILYYKNEVSNKYILEFLTKEYPFVSTSLFLHQIYNRVCRYKWLEENQIKLKHGSRDVSLIRHIIKSPWQLDKQLEHRCEEILYDKYGISNLDKLVLLQTRDSAYLSSKYPKADWSYHSYRDVDSKNYSEAISYLIKNKVYVIRHTRKALEPVNIASPYFIDYPFEEINTDQMDLYLSSRCSFNISSGLGSDSIPLLFDKPAVYTDFIPLSYIPSYVSGIVLHKRYLHVPTNNLLSIEEVFARNLDQCLEARLFLDQQITWLDNTPQEIASAVSELAGPLLKLPPYDEYSDPRSNKSYSVQYQQIVFSQFEQKGLIQTLQPCRSKLQYANRFSYEELKYHHRDIQVL